MFRVLVVVTALLVAACHSASTDPHPLSELRSATYSGIYDQPVTLAQGIYQGEPFVVDGASRPVVTLLAQQPWELDVDQDGSPETLVLLSESSGGSGTFIYLALMSATDRGYRNISTVLLGDRVRVAELTAEDGLLTVLIDPRSSIDPMMLGNDRITRWWQLIDGRLAELTEMAGQLTFGHEVREFVPCDLSRSPLWVSDETGGETLANLAMSVDEPQADYKPLALYQPLGPYQPPGPYQPLFVTFLGRTSEAPVAGFAEPYREQVTVVELLRAEREGHGCGLDLAGASYRALGVEPFWVLEVFADRLELRTPSIPSETFVVDGRSSRANLESMDIVAVDASGSDVRLQLRRQTCHDSMVGNRFAWQAQLTLSDRQMSGCALTVLPDR